MNSFSINGCLSPIKAKIVEGAGRISCFHPRLFFEKEWSEASEVINRSGWNLMSRIMRFCQISNLRMSTIDSTSPGETNKHQTQTLHVTCKTHHPALLTNGVINSAFCFIQPPLLAFSFQLFSDDSVLFRLLGAHTRSQRCHVSKYY